MKLLVVEDDRALNQGIALSFAGETVVSAFCVKEAEKLFDDSFDLVILDINLPDGSGLDLCREIRKSSHVPIIFLTANDMEIDIVTGLESGADDYITKPFSLAVLRARVNAVTRRRMVDGAVVTVGNYSFDFESMKFLEVLEKQLLFFDGAMGTMVQSYGIAIVKPAEGKADAVKQALQDFVTHEQMSMEHYLEDQYQIAKAAKVEVLPSGEVVLVCCKNSDAVLSAIKTALAA